MSNKDVAPAIRVALITGGTTGIGGATARELSACGYKLLVTALSDPNNIQQEIRGGGGTITFLKSDFAHAERTAKEIVDATIALYGRIDLLVNSAGTISHKNIDEVTSADWDRIIEINLKAPFFMMQQAFPHLKMTKGNIINVSSTNAVHPARKNHLYDSLKAALNNLTKGFALEYRQAGVRVNAVMPSGVRTPLVDQWLREYLGREPNAADYENPAIAEPVQIAKVIASLASDDMAWVNGAELFADGGYGLG